MKKSAYQTPAMGIIELQQHGQLLAGSGISGEGGGISGGGGIDIFVGGDGSIGDIGGIDGFDLVGGDGDYSGEIR